MKSPVRAAGDALPLIREAIPLQFEITVPGDEAAIRSCDSVLQPAFLQILLLYPVKMDPIGVWLPVSSSERKEDRNSLLLLPCNHLDCRQEITISADQNRIIKRGRNVSA